MYSRIVEETLEYVTREMTSPEGGFYSAQDADSEGVEGKFFVWLPQEITKALGDEDGEIFCRYYGVTTHGNFEGRNILRVAMDAANLAREEGLDASGFGELLNRSRAKLLEVRNERIAPALDDKILTSWNGLMLAAFAEAAAVFGRRDYAEIAERNAEFLLTNLLRDGRLLRTYKDGRAKLNGYLEDYAFMIDGLLALHEVNFSRDTLDAAIQAGQCNGGAVLGCGVGAILRYRTRPRGACGAPQRCHRQRDSVRQFNGGGCAAAPCRYHGRR